MEKLRRDLPEPVVSGSGRKTHGRWIDPATGTVQKSVSAAWRSTWAQQREEDRIRSTGDRATADAARARIPAPPRYASSDFRKVSYWRLHGKYDVPRERFISYPLPAANGQDMLWAGPDGLPKTGRLS